MAIILPEVKFHALFYILGKFENNAPCGGGICRGGTAFSLLALLGCEVCREFSRDDKKLLRVCLLCLYCMLYVLYLACMRAAEKRRAKKAKFAAMKYREEYVLPERGNGYVRDKLREAALYSRENAANGGATAGGVYKRSGKQKRRGARSERGSGARRISSEKVEKSRTFRKRSPRNGEPGGKNIEFVGERNAFG